MALTGRLQGNSVVYTNTGSAIASGAVVALKDCIGIATVAIPATTGTGVVSISGVHELAKTTSQAWALGDLLFWDATTAKLTNVPVNNADGCYFAGYAHAAAGAAGTTGLVRLAPFGECPGREITLAATGNQVLHASHFTGGDVRVAVPNTAALTVTFPAMAGVAKSVFATIHKTASAAFAITVAANADDTLVGATGTIDALNDRSTLITATGGPIVIASTIA
jgi:predicted RecA/RadA family phage recombinase